MHFRALRRDNRECSSDTALSSWGFSRGDFGSTGFIPGELCLFGVVARAQIRQQLDQALQLVPARVRYGTVVKISHAPEEQVITVACRALWHAAAICGPTEDVDDVPAVLVNHNCRALMIEVIGAAADEAIALRGEVGDER